jgi:4-amino-4-deoxy-L-arabinose transferase-like glycosyltransferase
MPRPTRGYVLALAGLGALAFTARLVYGLAAPDPAGFGDDAWYHVVANNLASGRGFSNPLYSLSPDGKQILGTGGEPVPTAFHLPLFPAVLALGSELGADSYRAHQAMGWAFGAGTVMTIGLIGRRLGGPRTGLIAAAIAALYLPLIINDSLGMSESLYGLLIALVILAALRLLELPLARRAVALGIALGLAALTRQEALLLVLLLLPVVLRAGGPRWRNAGLLAATVALLTAPWAIRNTVEFDQPVLLTTGEGSVIGCANGHESYYGHIVGGCDHDPRSTRAGRSGILNEADKSDVWRRDGLRYAADHVTRVPLVMAARIGRTWALYPLSPRAKANFGAYLFRHIYALEYVALASYAVVLGLAATALPLLRRRSGFPLWLLVAPIVLVTLVSAFGYGDSRFRQAAEVPLVLLAAVAVDRLWTRWRTRSAEPPQSEAAVGR